MKVIDLLNKIANGEEVPKKIKYGNEILILNDNKNNYLYEYSDEYYGCELFHWFRLDEEVEIIEEPKKIEKIDYRFGLKYIKSDMSKEARDGIDEEINFLHSKINELIDEVNKINERKID